MAQQNTIAREESIEEGNEIEESCDVSISFFGGLTFRTAGGSLAEQEFNAPVGMPIIAYLLLKQERAHTPMEIFEKLFPDEVYDNNSIRGAIYRFKRAYTKATGQKNLLIIREGGGYLLNPEVKVTTDIQRFDDHIKAAGLTTAPDARIELLKKAFELYKGPIFQSGCDQPWIVDMVRHYEVRYIKAVEALLQELAKQGKYAEVIDYASKAHALFPGNGIFCYWLIAANDKLSGATRAKEEYERLRPGMIPEEDATVVKRLTEGTELKYGDLFVG